MSNNKEPLKESYKKLALYFILLLICSILFKFITYFFIIVF